MSALYQNSKLRAKVEFQRKIAEYMTYNILIVVTNSFITLNT